MTPEKRSDDRLAWEVRYDILRMPSYYCWNCGCTPHDHNDNSACLFDPSQFYKNSIYSWEAYRRYLGPMPDDT